MSGRLFTPVEFGPVKLENRVISTSHQTSLVADHLPTEDLVAYHGARARGGVGAIFLEATAVDPTGLLTPKTLGGYLPGIVNGYERLVDAVRPAGAKLFVQLFHGGREQFGSPPRAPAVAPSPVPSTRFHSEPRGLSGREVSAMIAGFARSAGLARDGGLDGIEVSMAHGYLAAQFFSPRTNQRDDRYGPGSPLRFGLEVLEAIREVTGREIAVGVRLAASERDPDGDGTARCAEIAAAICQSGLVDFVSLALGYSGSYPASSWIAPPSPAPVDAIAESLPRSGTLDGVPVIATTRIVDLDQAERILSSGAAQAVGMTRALIAEPDLVRNAEAGRADESIPCIGCNQACIGHYHEGVPIGCVVNPRTGREGRLSARRVKETRRVLVVGAGPAGVAAAVEAARGGNPVALAERGDDIGGQFRLAGGTPGHEEMWRRYHAFARRELETSGVELRLGTTVHATDLDVETNAARIGGETPLVPEHGLNANDFEVVILATGAKPYLPFGAPDDRTVTDAWSAIRSPESVAGPVLVADWGGGWDGLDAAEVLAASGHEVTFVCGGVTVGETLHQYQRNGYLERLHRAGVTMLQHFQLVEDDRQGFTLRHAFSGIGRALPDGVTTVVVAYGRQPEDTLWPVLEGRRRSVRVGDVLGPRTLEEAVLEGFLAGRGEFHDRSGRIDS